MTTIYGIKNCDTMKKAFSWLGEHGIAYTFHDYRAAGIERAVLEGWVATLGWEKVLNRTSSTFRALPEEDKAGLDEDRAIALMAANPTMIKRPMLVRDGSVTAGFKPEIYAGLFGKQG